MIRSDFNDAANKAAAVHNIVAAKVRLFKQLFDLAEGWRGGATTAAIVAEARALLRPEPKPGGEKPNG